LGFSLSNGKWAQSDIRYSIRLVKEDENKKRSNVYQKVYDDKITLAENSKIEKNINIELPDYLDWEYELWLLAENVDWLPLSSNIVGKINLKSSNNQYINISNCYLSIKGLPEKYSLWQWVDIASNEDLILSCEAESFFDTIINSSVVIDTFKRTVYWDKVIINYEPANITFNSKEKKKIDIAIPKSTDPQSYDISVILKDGDKEISNTIDAHYVIQWESVTVSNLQLDKSTYVKWDKITTSFLWSLSADSFLGSRKSFKEKEDNRILYYNLSIYDNNKQECITPVKHNLLEKNILINKSINDSIIDCDNPSVRFAIVDEKWKILLEKDYNFIPSKTDKVIESKQEIKKENLTVKETEKKSNTNNIILIVIITFIILTLAILWFKPKNKLMNIFVFLILWSLFFGNNTDKVEATSLIRDVGDKISCDYTVNSNTGDITPGANITVTSNKCTITTCGNEITIDFYIWSTSIPYADQIPLNYDYGSVLITWSFANTNNNSVTYTTSNPPSVKNIIAASTTGYYKIPLKFIYKHYSGWQEWQNTWMGPYGCNYDNYDSSDSIPYACSDNYNLTKTSMVTRPGACRWDASIGQCAWFKIIAKDYITYNVIEPPPPTCTLSYSPATTEVWNTITWKLTSTNAVSAKSWCAAHLQPITTLNPSWISGTWPVTSTTEQWIDCKTEVTNSVWVKRECTGTYKFTPPQPTCWTANWYTFAYDDSWWLWKTYCKDNWSVENPISPDLPEPGTFRNWTCNLNWHNTSCSASRASLPPSYWSCWTANWYSYTYNNTNWLGKTFCANWAVVQSVDPTFPDEWTTAYWKCIKDLNIVNCSAYRAPEEIPPQPVDPYSCYYISNWLPKWSTCNVFEKNVCSEKCEQENRWKAVRTYMSWNCWDECSPDDEWMISCVQRCDWWCNPNEPKPANEIVDKTINIDDCPAIDSPWWYCWDSITQNLWNSDWLEEACDDWNTDNNDTCTNNCTDPHSSQPWEWTIIENATCDLSDSWYANNSDTNAIYATLSVETEDHKDAINLWTPSAFVDLSNNKVDRVYWTGPSSLEINAVTTNIIIKWDWSPQKVKIADVKSKTPFVSCNNKVSFSLWWQNMVLGNIWYNFKKPYVWDLQASTNGWDTWDAKPSIWTMTTYRLSAIDPKFILAPSSYDISLTNDKISYIWENIILQDTILGDIEWPYKFKTRINSSATATELNQTPWLQVTLPIISYDLWWDNVKYYLSTYDYGNDKTPIKLDWDPFLWVKIIWGLQWAWKYEFTWQWKNISNLYPSDLRTEIRKRAYNYISSMSGGTIINNVMYVYWDWPISWDLNYETLVVVNWNVKITWDLNTSKKKLWIIVLKDNYSTSNWYDGKWNILVTPGVKTINAIIYADGWFMSADSSWNLYTTDSIDRTNALQYQLTMNWSLFTRNTIWWAQLGWVKNGWIYILPGWTTTPLFDKAMIYDLNYIRRWNIWCDTNNSWNCYDNGEIKEWFIIKYDSRIQIDPPKLFYK
jgi:hypothetical protein